jgi:uncharacterized DUF497 family protein
MSRQNFEYDARKAASNLRKHGVSFGEAMTVFNDPLAQTFPDDLHSEDEDRSITIGLSSKERILFLSHCEREARIRIIGARPANAAEVNAYEELKARS